LLIYYQTGASRHYAYIEMSSKSVAEIVAETMNNYLLMGHLLKCQVGHPLTQRLGHADTAHRSSLPKTFIQSFGSVPTRSSERCPVPE
jgi:nucleolar protein 15